MTTQCSIQSPTQSSLRFLTPSAVADILRHDAAFWTGAYVDPCGHSHEVRVRLERERLAALEATIGDMTDDQLAAVVADPAYPQAVRKAAGLELHMARGVAPSDPDACPQCGGTVHGVGPMTPLGQDAECSRCDWRWEA